jgi:hypothetical protein
VTLSKTGVRATEGENMAGVRGWYLLFERMSGTYT